MTAPETPSDQTGEHGAFRHPLTRTDDVLVQDFMLTKVTLLLAQNASSHEWHFEIEAMRATSTNKMQDRNAFLLDYTLARYIAAFERNAITAPLSPASAATNYLDSFARAFAEAVGAESFRAAVNIWSASRDIDALGIGPHGDLTLALLTALLRGSTSPVPADTAQYIPAAYSAEAPR